LRILNVMQCTNLGGMEQASLRQMVGLIERGHTCRVLSLNSLGALKAMLDSHGIPAEGMGYSGKGGWRSIYKLRRKLREYEVDSLIMTGHNLLAMQALGAVNVDRSMLAIHFHHEGVKPEWQWRLIYWMACRRFDAITFPSEYIRREALNIYPSLRAISHVVRNPLRVPPLPSVDDRMSARRDLGLPERAKLVGNAGWLIKRKRFDVFLRVAQSVCARTPEAYFVVAGDGEERADLVRLASELGIVDKVKWLGWQSEMSTLYKALDVLLFNSDWDAFPTTPLEAMSYGLPVVASLEHGGLDEVILNEENGYLYGSHDIEALASAVMTCIAGSGGQIGIRGRERVRKLCDFDDCVNEIENILTVDEDMK